MKETPRMIGYRRGDIVLVGFIFTDEKGEKRRPALVISSDAYQLNRREVIIVAITSMVERRLIGDILIADWQGAGLLFPSVVTGIIRTVKQNIIVKKLGNMPDLDMQAVESNLLDILELKSKI
jgi:mRNA interferase MazF